jgi:hypothetical protein
MREVADFVLPCATSRAARDVVCSSKGSFTLIQGTPELAIAGARFALKIRPQLLGSHGDCRWVWQARASCGNVHCQRSQTATRTRFCALC